MLSAGEIAEVKALCHSNDADKGSWDNAVNGMSTSVETFYEPTDGAGKWVANTSTSAITGLSGDSADAVEPYDITKLAKVTHDDTAVDSYALSASGPLATLIIACIPSLRTTCLPANDIALPSSEVAAR